MTINGPAPMLLGFFLNTAIDQQCEKHILENGLKAEVTAKIMGIYREKGIPDPAYNTSLPGGHDGLGLLLLGEIGRAACRERVCQCVLMLVVAELLTKKK